MAGLGGTGGVGGMYGGMVQPPHGQPAGVPQQGMPQQNKPQQNMPQQGMPQQQQQQNILQQQRMSQNMAQVGMQQTVLPQLSHLQQQGGVGTTSISTPIGTTLTSPSKDVTVATSPNVASLCKCGQDLVHDIFSKTIEMFQYARFLQNLPHCSATNPAGQQTILDRKNKVEDVGRGVFCTFERLHQVYNKVKDSSAVSPQDLRNEVLVENHNHELHVAAPKVTEQKMYANEEYRMLAEQLRQKNKSLKEIIDKERTLMWEINTMMIMRKSDVHG